MRAVPSLPGLRILGTLGKGGMGAVYKAEEEKVGRIVAVKVLGEALCRDPAFVERFLREAKYLAKVRHPNLVTIYDAVVRPGVPPHYTMEYVEGTTLSRRLEEKPMAWPQVRALLEPVLEGLAAVHRAGLVHRDLKPGNVLLDAAGRPKVMDFGLAKGSDASLTQEGMILGTPEYMAPEQAKGDPVTPASDVYAMGVIAHQMLTGRLPFQGENTVQTLRMQCYDPAPPLEGVPPEARAWVSRAMSKDPAARFQDAGAMLAALKGEPERPPTVALPAAPPPPSRRTGLWIAAGVLVLLAALAALKAANRRPAGPRVGWTRAGERLEGELLELAPDGQGGHRLKLRVGGKVRELVLPPGAEASLEFGK